MTKEELAAQLNGRTIGWEITDDEAKQAAADRLVVVFGASDDLCEFRGDIQDEVDCHGGTEILLHNRDLYDPECCDDCPHEKRLAAKLPRIKTLWCDRGADWSYDIPWPHALFHIYEDGELYCIGAVFSTDDVPWVTP